MRTEIDECDDRDVQDPAIKKFEADVLTFLQSESESDAPSVCKWNEPKGEVVEKTLGPDGYVIEAASQGASAMMIFGVAFVAVGAVGYKYFM